DGSEHGGPGSPSCRVPHEHPCYAPGSRASQARPGPRAPGTAWPAIGGQRSANRGKRAYAASVNFETDRVADLAGRPLNVLTRRDVALALLTVPSADALASLPGIRRGMLAAGNPLSAVFWSSAEAILHQID